MSSDGAWLDFGGGGDAGAPPGTTPATTATLSATVSSDSAAKQAGDGQKPVVTTSSDPPTGTSSAPASAAFLTTPATSAPSSSSSSNNGGWASFSSNSAPSALPQIKFTPFTPAPAAASTSTASTAADQTVTSSPATQHDAATIATHLSTNDWGLAELEQEMENIEEDRRQELLAEIESNLSRLSSSGKVNPLAPLPLQSDDSIKFHSAIVQQYQSKHAALKRQAQSQSGGKRAYNAMSSNTAASDRSQSLIDLGMNPKRAYRTQQQARKSKKQSAAAKKAEAHGDKLDARFQQHTKSQQQRKKAKY